MTRKTLVFALAGCAFALAPLSGAVAGEDWERFENGVKKGFFGAKHGVEHAAGEVEHGAKKGVRWSERKVKDATDDDDDDDDWFKKKKN